MGQVGDNAFLAARLGEAAPGNLKNAPIWSMLGSIAGFLYLQARGAMRALSETLCHVGIVFSHDP